MELTEKELIAIIKREKVRDAWKIIDEAVHSRLPRLANDPQKDKNVKMRKTLYDVGVYIGV